MLVPVVACHHEPCFIEARPCQVAKGVFEVKFAGDVMPLFLEGLQKFGISINECSMHEHLEHVRRQGAKDDLVDIRDEIGVHGACPAGRRYTVSRG